MLEVTVAGDTYVMLDFCDVRCAAPFFRKLAAAGVTVHGGAQAGFANPEGSSKAPAEQRVLAYLRCCAEPAAVRVVASELGIPVGSAYAHLSVLTRRGVAQRAGKGLYRATLDGSPSAATVPGMGMSDAPRDA